MLMETIEIEYHMNICYLLQHRIDDSGRYQSMFSVTCVNLRRKNFHIRHLTRQGEDRYANSDIR